LSDYMYKLYWILHYLLGNTVIDIPSFRYRDNSVYLHECSPFWYSGIFITFNKENYHVHCCMYTCAFGLTEH